MRLVFDHEVDHSSRWTACQSIAAKIGCSAHTLLDWVKRAEIDAGKRAGLPTDTAEKIKALERENRELRQANEILRKASAYFGVRPLEWTDQAAWIDRVRTCVSSNLLRLIYPRAECRRVSL